jgi:S-adenosylhomocysteine hydrolase
MKIYYEDDANLEIIQSMNVTIVGYGSQGHAHANNLHESGVNVTVALREGSSSWKKAEEAGLNVSSVSESVKNADLVMILAPDEFQKDIYESEVKPNLKQDAILAFAHGFNIHFEKIKDLAPMEEAGVSAHHRFLSVALEAINFKNVAVKDALIMAHMETAKQVANYNTQAQNIVSADDIAREYVERLK